jgi:quinol monooxygenase YgiN
MAPEAKQGFNIQASIYVDPDRLDEFFDAIRPMCEKTKEEPECVFFEAYQAQDDPGHIRLVENWFVPPT